MTFEERCKRFEKNSENEINSFKKVYRFIFLNKKKKEQIEIENILLTQIAKK